MFHVNYLHLRGFQTSLIFEIGQPMNTLKCFRIAPIAIITLKYLLLFANTFLELIAKGLL